MASSEPSLENGQLAAAAAAAPVAETPQLHVVDDDEIAPVATEHEIELQRAADGSLGLSVASDEEGRPVVKVGREGVLPGDIITAIDGSEIYSSLQIDQEIRRSLQTGGFRDSIVLRLLRPRLTMQPTQWSTTGIEIVAGKSVHVPLIVDEPALGSYSFTCNGDGGGGGRITFALDFCEGAGASKKLIMPKSNRAGEGTFHVPTGGIVTAYLSNDEAYLSSVTVQATVRLTPLTQAVAAEGASLRLAIDAQAAHLEMLEKHEAGLRTQELELEQKLASMRAARLAATYLRESDSEAYNELWAAAERLEQAAIADDERVAATEGASGTLWVAGYINAAKQSRLHALDGRRNIRERALKHEEKFMRAQVMSAEFDDGDEGEVWVPEQPPSRASWAAAPGQAPRE